MLFNQETGSFHDAEVYIERPCPSGFYLDIAWTDKDGIKIKATKLIYFKNDVSICSSETLFQVDYTFNLMSIYFPILYKAENKSEIKKAISKTIIEMAKNYRTENRSMIEHLEFVYDDDRIYIDIRV